MACSNPCMRCAASRQASILADVTDGPSMAYQADIGIKLLMRSSYRTVAPYITKDGSYIRELMHPAVHGNRNQSVAEATVPARGRTALHLHRATEEIYHIT